MGLLPPEATLAAPEAHKLTQPTPPPQETTK